MDLEKQNISLMTKWWWKLETQEGLWQSIVKAKYFKRHTVASVKAKLNDSPCWKNILKVKDVYMAGRKVILKNEKITRLWLDPWSNNTLLCDQFPQLFDICQKQNCTIADLISCDFQIPFRNRLVGELAGHWDNVITAVLLSKDHTILSKTEVRLVFKTKSVYTWLQRNIAGANNKWIWKASIPLKIKIFMWQLFRNTILTRDNL